MRLLRKEEFLDYLKSHNIEVFSLKDAAKILNKPLKYTSLRLSGMNNVVRVERGKYYALDANIYEIATGITVPSYVSLISAYAFHGMTTQIPIEIQVICPVQHKEINTEGYKIRFIKIPRSRIFGFSRFNSSMIAESEKAIVDSLYLNTFVEETKKVLQGNRESLDANKLIKYALRMESEAIVKRLGFLMERYGYNVGSLPQLKLGRYVLLGSGGHNKSKKWRVMFAD